MGSLHLLELPYAQPLVVVAVVAVVVDDVNVLAGPHLVLVVLTKLWIHSSSC